jgi:hypothetical protein
MEPFVPDSYSQLLADLKGRIQATQIRASLAINRELGVGFAFVGSEAPAHTVGTRSSIPSPLLPPEASRRPVHSVEAGEAEPCLEL